LIVLLDDVFKSYVEKLISKFEQNQIFA